MDGLPLQPYRQPYITALGASSGSIAGGQILSAYGRGFFGATGVANVAQVYFYPTSEPLPFAGNATAAEQFEIASDGIAYIQVPALGAGSYFVVVSSEDPDLGSSPYTAQSIYSVS